MGIYAGLRAALRAGIALALTAALMVIPAGWVSHAAAAPITCADGTSPMSLTYNMTGATPPTITLPLTGMYSSPGVTVDWGDGTTSTYTTGGNQSHTFPASGAYTVQICGSLTWFGTVGNAVPNAWTLTKVNSFGTLPLLSNLSYAFMNAMSLTDLPATLPATVTNLSGTFKGADILNDPDIKGWDTRNVTDMSWLFSGTSKFNQNLSGWSTDALTKADGIFYGTGDFNNGCAPSVYTCPLTWTTPVLTNAEAAFGGASKFNQSVNSWDVSRLPSFVSFFSNSAFNNGCAAGDTGCPLPWTVGAPATTLAQMFASAWQFNQNVTKLLASSNNVSIIAAMFSGAGMFNNATNDPRIDTWQTGTVTNMANTFQSAVKFNRHIEAWDVSSVTTMRWMFLGADAFNNGCVRGDRACALSWSDTGKVTTINSMFSHYTTASAGVASFDQSVNTWNISSITDFAGAFSLGVFNNGGQPLWPGKAAKAGSNMNQMFAFNATFNVPVADLDVSGVKTMGSMFLRATGFDQDISAWNLQGLAGSPGGLSMQGFMNLAGFSTANYEKFLNSLGSVSSGSLVLTRSAMNTWTPSTYSMHMGNSRYTCNTQALRTALAAKVSITDGGMAPLPAPTITSVTPGDTVLTVAFTPPVCGTTPQAPASYQYSKDNGVTWVAFAAPTPDASAAGTLLITGLTNGTAYPLRIRALTASGGIGAPSDRVDGTPFAPLTLEPVITVADKTYDGTTRATITNCQLRVKNSNPVQYITDTTQVSCDLSAATAMFGSANAADTVPVTATGAALTGPRAADYVLGAISANPAKISKATLTVVPDPVTVEQGTSANAVTYPLVVNGWVNGDGPSTTGFSAPTCSAADYTNTKITTDSPLTITCTGGTAPANYTLDTSATANLTIIVTEPPVPVVATITAQDKVYDGTRDAVITCTISGAPEADGLSCDLTGATVQFDTKDVGNAKTVTVSGIKLTNLTTTNYQLSVTTRTALANITPVSVTPVITAANKTYDKSDAATILTCTLTGVVAADSADVTCVFSGAVATFADANAGTGKKVTATGLAVANNSAGNYVATSDTAETTASITKAPLTLKALPDTKVYDGTDISHELPLTGLLGGESSNAKQKFDSVNAGSRTLSLDIVCGSVTITEGGVDVTGNYDITCDTTSAVGTITKAPVSIVPASDTKPYDRSATSAGSPVVTGLVGGDSISATQQFDSADSGSRSLTVAAGYSFTAGIADNYDVDATATAIGSITPVGPIRIKAPSVQYPFNGSTPTLTPTVTGLLSGDSFSSDPVCKVYATTDLAYATPVTSFALLTPGTYTVHCGGAVAGSNYTEIIYEDGVLQPLGAATFQGTGLTFTNTNSASVTLSATVEPGTAGCYAIFTLFDSNDVARYTFGPFNAATGAVATTQTVDVGEYTVRVTAFGNCYGSTDGTDTLSVVHDSVGRGSVGGGFYKSGATPPKVNFGYEVQTTSTTKGGVTTTTTKGQLLWIAKAGWRVKGSVNYSSTNGSTAWTRIACPSEPTSIWPTTTKPMCGQFQGTGKLQRLNPSTLVWETYDANIRFTATVYDGGQVTTCKSKTSCTTTQYPDFFGIRIWASDGSQILPGTVSPAIPTGDPVQLANGQIKVFAA